MPGENRPGFVDIHCHILPGLDDGPEELESSIEMAQVASACGTTDLVATPHSNYQWGYEVDRIEQLLGELRQVTGNVPHLTRGCDFHLSYENIQDALVHPRKYSINGGRYLLVEFPDFFNIDAMETALNQLIGVGLVPVLTHPERNPVFQQNREVIPRYIRLGCIVQITAGVFKLEWGNTALKAAEDLLSREWVHVIASDGHSPNRRSPRLDEAFEAVRERQGEPVARALLSDNPRAIVQDEELTYLPEVSERKKTKRRWAFLRG
jgi:protein-tyrosine phosphatase